MWSEKRRLEGILVLGYISIILSIIGITTYIVPGTFIASINIENTSIMSIIPTVAVIIAAAVNMNIKADDDKLYEIKRYMFKYKIIQVMLFIYIGYILVVYTDIKTLFSAGMLEASFLSIYILKRKIKSLELSDIQLRWRKAYDYPDSEEAEAGLWWRIKPMFSPHVNVEFKKRVKQIRLYKLIIFFIIIYHSEFDKISLLISLICILDVLYLLEVTLGLFTKTTGLCTGVVENESSKGHRMYYTVYVTDYENKREIVFKVADGCYIKERDMITVVHSVITKRVIEVEGMRMNII